MTATTPEITPAGLRQAADALEQLQQQLEDQRQNVVELLTGRGISIPSAGRVVNTSNGQKRHLSPEAIQKIRAAQKKRWKTFHKQKEDEANAAAQTAPAAPATPVAPTPAPAQTTPPAEPAKVATGATPAPATK